MNLYYLIILFYSCFHSVLCQFPQDIFCSHSNTSHYVNIVCQGDEYLAKTILRFKNKLKEEKFQDLRNILHFNIEIKKVKNGSFSLDPLFAIPGRLNKLSLLDRNLHNISTSEGNNTKIKDLKELKLVGSRNFNITSLGILQRTKLEELHIEGIDLEGNRSKVLRQLINLTRVTKLSVRKSSLSHFPLHLFDQPALTHLDVSNNRIRKLSNGSDICHIIERLTYLNISNNKLRCIEEINCGDLVLETLDASNNQIGSCFYSLTKEPCPWCSIFSYPLQYDYQMVRKFKELRHLSLKNNTLSLINGRIIINLKRLVYLDLSFNEIESITDLPDEASSLFNRRLQTLKLNDNKISRITVIEKLLAAIDNDNLQQVDLHGNQWNCDCMDIHAMLHLKNMHIRLEKYLISTKCHFSEHFLNRSVFGLDQNQVCNQEDHGTVFLISLVVTFLILVVIVIAFYTSCLHYATPFLLERLSPPADYTVGRRFDAVIAYNINPPQNEARVRAALYNPLKELGYNIAMFEDIYKDDNIERNITNIISNSRRMIVYANEFFLKDEFGNRLLNQGLQEEHETQGFQVIAIEDGLPYRLTKELYTIVSMRSYVMSTDRNYLKEIIKFLPQPNLEFEESNMTFENLENYLRTELRKIEIRKRGHNSISTIQSMFSEVNDLNVPL